jgi:hypothetical protein
MRSQSFGVSAHGCTLGRKCITCVCHAKIGTHRWSWLLGQIADWCGVLFLQAALDLGKWHMRLLQEVLVYHIPLKALYLVPNPFLGWILQGLLGLDVVVLLQVSTSKRIEVIRAIRSPVVSPARIVLQSVFLEWLEPTLWIMTILKLIRENKTTHVFILVVGFCILVGKLALECLVVGRVRPILVLLDVRASHRRRVHPNVIILDQVHIFILIAAPRQLVVSLFGR